MKKILLTICFACLCMLTQAQQEKLRVAVLDPTTSGIAMDDGTKLAVQELISSTFVNTGRYIIIERSMIDKIIKEQSFQNSDMADNSQATEIGKLAGANKVVLSAVSMVGGRNMLSVKIIDVTTASIDKQKTKIVGSSDLLDAVEPLTLELLGEQAEYVKQNTVFAQQETPKTEAKPKQAKPAPKKSPSKSNGSENSNYDFDMEYQKICEQVEAGLKSVPTPYNAKVQKALVQFNVLGRNELGGGISATLSETGVLTIEGSGAMIPPDNNLFGSQVKNAKVIVVSEGITKVCGLESSKAQYVKLPSTLEAIDEKCFEDCSDLIAVNIPPSVKKIGKQAFAKCKKLASVAIPENIEYLGQGAFTKCESLLSITIPNSITMIPDALLKNCSSLRNIYFSSEITSIGKESFCGCKSCQKINLPSSVVSLGDGCFRGMHNLYEIHLPEGITKIPNKAFDDCKSLSKIICPASVRSVGENAFEDCENLVQIIFLSEFMNEMGEACFKDCTNLSNIVLYSIKPPTCHKKGLFDGEKEFLQRVTLSVHPAGYAAYQKAKIWENFGVITRINL